MKKIISSLLLTLINILISNHVFAIDLVGKWITVEKDDNRYNDVYIFKDNGKFEFFYCQIFESNYKVENNILTITELTPKVDPPVRKYFYNVKGDVLTFNAVVSENPLELSERWEAVRLPEREYNSRFPLVGRWHIKVSDYPRVSHEYSENGIRLSMFQEVSYVRGIYAIVNEKLRLWPATAKTYYEYNFEYTENELTLIENDSIKKKYKKIY